MITPEMVVAEALSWLGTPWQHRQGAKGLGVDCVHLPLRIGQALGMIPSGLVIPYYTTQWHLHKRRGQDEFLLETLRIFPLHEVPKDAGKPGDIAIVRWVPRQPCSHAGIILPGGWFLHAVCGQDINRVIRQRLQGLLLRQVAHIYRYNALESACQAAKQFS